MSSTLNSIPGAAALVDAMERTDPKRVFIHGEHARLTYGAAVDRIGRATGLCLVWSILPALRRPQRHWLGR